MRIRTLALGLSLLKTDFLDGTLALKIKNAAVKLRAAIAKLSADGYEVQTIRITLNDFEDWIDVTNPTVNIKLLCDELRNNSIEFCSIGSCSNPELISIIPTLLKVSNSLYTSVSFSKKGSRDFVPDFDVCKMVAEIILSIAGNDESRHGCFNFCAVFNCPPNIPFFPASYHTLGEGETLTVGLENGDLLFISFHGVKDLGTAKFNLMMTLQQVLEPLQKILVELCQSLDIVYGGIDASICPGMGLPVDSVGNGIEELLKHIPSNSASTFGQLGTLSVVSCITSAIKELQTTSNLRLIGYSGLMLPVMEDLCLALRASTGSYTVRDLLLFSSVCGVGLDTVPIPGDTPVAAIAGTLLETGTLAFRLNKPLSCRLLPMPNRVTGEQLTAEDIRNPYLCPCRVFAVL